MLSSLSYGFVLPAAAPRTSASRPMMLSPNGDELATMYRQRWASAEAAPSSGYTYEFATEEFEVQEPACITQCAAAAARHRAKFRATSRAAAATPPPLPPLRRSIAIPHPAHRSTLQPAHRSRPPLRSRSFDKQAKMKKNTCGKTSFDSFDGMTCVEEPASGKWVCQ